MKKILLALTAVAAFSGSAVAADMAPRTYSKAPPPVVVAPSWTGFYIFGGAGGGIWDATQRRQVERHAGAADHQLAPRWRWLVRHCRCRLRLAVQQQLGIRHPRRWPVRQPCVATLPTRSVRSAPSPAPRSSVIPGRVVRAWATWVAPNVLSYVNGGWTGSSWSGSTLTTMGGTPSGLHTNSYTTNSGVFVGGGVENNLNIFGISSPGWFMKTEYALPISAITTSANLRCDRRAWRRHDRREALRADHQHLAGLSLQLRAARSSPSTKAPSTDRASFDLEKPRLRPGLFCALTKAVRHVESVARPALLTLPFSPCFGCGRTSTLPAQRGWPRRCQRG